MCKLAGWTASKSSSLSRQSANRALIAAREIISKTERCGYGFAQPSATGLHGRFVKPDEFKTLDALPALSRLSGDAFTAFAAANRCEQTGFYNRHKPTIVHGRTATCAVNLKNTHPFRHDGWTLAHNGVISWHGKKSKLHAKATCDSQHLLYALSENAGDIEKQKEAMLHITGYAAFLAASPRGKLIVAVDESATLYAGITKKGRWIFGTKPEIVECIADEWRCKGVEAFRLDDWTWMEFSARGGDPVVSTWTHGQVTSRESQYAHRSLGRSLSEGSRGSWGESGYKSYKFERKADGVYTTQVVPSGKYDGLAARSEDVGLTQHNLDDDFVDERPINERFADEADLEADDLHGIGSYTPASQRTFDGIV